MISDFGFNGEPGVRRVGLAGFCCLAFLGWSMVWGGAVASSPHDSEDVNSEVVRHSPAPGTRGSAGSFGLEPWLVVAPVPVAVSRPAAEVVEGLFYVIGGEEQGGNRNGHVQIYDPVFDEWESNSADPMPTPGSNLCAAAIDGLIYVPGGWTGSDFISELQILDPATGTWTTAADDPLPGQRFGMACAEFDGRLYVIGGWDDEAATRTTWVYDPQEPAGTRWSTRADAPVDHVYGSAVVTSGGLIFLSGLSDNGTSNFDTVVAFDPVENEWTTYPSLQTARAGAGVWTAGNRLYVGGGGWASFLTTVESYDLDQGTAGSWEFTASLNVGRRSAAAATDPVTGQFFYAAGWAGDFLDSTETPVSISPPAITSVSPDVGPDAGGTRVTIAGENFTDAAIVSFDGQPCSAVDVVDQNTISCSTPPGPLGAVDVTVEQPHGQMDTLIDGFTYEPLPLWTEIDAAPVAVSRAAGAVVDGLFHVIGGEESGGGRNGHVQVYDPVAEGWDAVSADNMATPASNLCAAAIDGLIYVPGGWTGSVVLTDLQVFDPASGSWTTAAADPLPQARFAPACAALDGRLYVFGGWNGLDATGTAWVYDPEEPAGERWSALADSPFTHVYAGAVAASNGLIFVTGWSDNSSGNFDTVAAYDPAADDWISYPSLIAARGAASVWTVGDRLFVGGGGWSSFLTTVESYDLTMGTSGNWEHTSRLNVGRRTGAAATDPLTGRLFLATGWNGDFVSSAETLSGAGPLELVAVSPATGPQSGGTVVTLNGNGFQVGANVLFGSQACADIEIIDTQVITCTIPPGNVGLVDVTVENPDSQSSTLGKGFRYLLDLDDLFSDRFEEI